MSNYSIIMADDVTDFYKDTDVPGEFRSLGKSLESEQLSVSLIRIPPHSDFEQSTGHYHNEIEELYIITKGTLTMRFGDDIIPVSAGSMARVAPKTPRSHRNEGNETVEMWAVSRKLERDDSTLLKDFWEASDKAVQHRAKRSPA